MSYSRDRRSATLSHPPARIQNGIGRVQLVVIQDSPQPCPYVDGETARMPLELPLGSIPNSFTDEFLEGGYRRSGEFIYRTRCPRCSECKPTRLDVGKFFMSSSFRRVLRRGDRELSCGWGEPAVDASRVRLFNEHRRQRGLNVDSDDVDADGYHSFLVATFGIALELTVWDGDHLVAVSIIDLGAKSLSAVYTMFDPDYSRFSPGTYAILKQIEFAQRTGRQYVYLGMYVGNNRHLNYKSRYQPQERLEQGVWVAPFDDAAENGPHSEGSGSFSPRSGPGAQVTTGGSTTQE
ncbi:MAG: arginyltransferase [Planctomycetota bacterium]